MKILGVDFGSKRIGVAISDSEAGVPQLLPNLLASGTLKTDALAIDSLAQAHSAKLIVIGIPQSDHPGDGGRMLKACLKIADLLEEQGWEVARVDETFTSVESQNLLNEAGVLKSDNRAKRDGVAASLIIQRYLEKLPHA